MGIIPFGYNNYPQFRGRNPLDFLDRIFDDRQFPGMYHTESPAGDDDIVVNVGKNVTFQDISVKLSDDDDSTITIHVVHYEDDKKFETTRVVTVPSHKHFDVDNVEAILDNGLLIVTAPVVSNDDDTADEVEPVRINVTRDGEDTEQEDSGDSLDEGNDTKDEAE